MLRRYFGIFLVLVMLGVGYVHADEDEQDRDTQQNIDQNGTADPSSASSGTTLEQ